MIARLDHWIGKHLFVPPIIRLCQATGWTQYACHTYGWLFVSLNALFWTPTTVGQWLYFIFLGFGAVAWIVMGALNPDFHKRPNTMLRRIMLMLNIGNGLAVMLQLATGDPVSWRGMLSGIIILFAEYALTITTIPPREVKERQRKAAESMS